MPNNNSQLVREMKRLHGPNMHHGILVCLGCDSDAGDPPIWPCRTAARLFSDTEKIEIEEAERLYWKFQLENDTKLRFLWLIF